MNIFGGVNSARLSAYATTHRRPRRRPSSPLPPPRYSAVMVRYDIFTASRTDQFHRQRGNRSRQRYEGFPSRSYVRPRRYVSRGVDT